MMQLKEIIKKFEEKVPKHIEWEKDNSGLQLGEPGKEIRKILISLELTEETVKEAIETESDLIFTHHPFFFHPLKQLNLESPQGIIIKELIKSDISVYSSHTNFDQYKRGVSYALGKKLNLQNMKPLITEGEYYYKIVTFAPCEHAEKISSALSDSGAGTIGNYSNCSFQGKGDGYFKPLKGSAPFIGVEGKIEKTEEIKIEMIFPKWKTNEIINSLRSSHPYEEPAFDIIPLKNKPIDFGYGVTGELENPVNAKIFLSELKKLLSLPVIKTAGNLEKEIRRVALLGGSGGNYLSYALIAKADIFITADLHYHNYFDARDKIIIADGGHYETEIFGLDELKALLEDLFAPEIIIIKTKNITNPIIYF